MPGKPCGFPGTRHQPSGGDCLSDARFTEPPTCESVESSQIVCLPVPCLRPYKDENTYVVVVDGRLKLSGAAFFQYAVVNLLHACIFPFLDPICMELDIEKASIHDKIIKLPYKSS